MVVDRRQNFIVTRQNMSKQKHYYFTMYSNRKEEASLTADYTPMRLSRVWSVVVKTVEQRTEEKISCKSLPIWPPSLLSTSIWFFKIRSNPRSFATAVPQPSMDAQYLLLPVPYLDTREYPDEFGGVHSYWKSTKRQGHYILKQSIHSSLLSFLLSMQTLSEKAMGATFYILLWHAFSALRRSIAKTSV